jgi:hypothetical protein
MPIKTHQVTVTNLQPHTACSTQGPVHVRMSEAPRAAWYRALYGFSPLHFPLRSGAVVILTSATRSGGEVRITEAERPRHVHQGQRGATPESRRTAPHKWTLYYIAVTRPLCELWSHRHTPIELVRRPFRSAWIWTCKWFRLIRQLPRLE